MQTIPWRYLLLTFTYFAVDHYYFQSCLWLVASGIATPASVCQETEMSQIIYSFSCGMESKKQSNVQEDESMLSFEIRCIYHFKQWSDTSGNT